MSEIITSNGLLAAIIFFLVFLLQQISVVLVRRFNKDKIEDIHRYFYNSLATPERRKKIIILLIVGPLSIYLLSLLAGDGDIIFTAYLGASLFTIAYFINLCISILVTGFILSKQGENYLHLVLKTDLVLIVLGLVYFIIYIAFYETAFIMASFLSAIAIGSSDYVKVKKLIKNRTV
ncbi:hypothetical protein JCM9140_2744 [Halalkalibacter wakoensis JCM 9140]|uniref:Uncharacterized protein n=1 Tax=Halalkalibacter wakoensis JCM 9140 TaxID=1236970 RepID=W4Q3X9_9BACI|nr:hypothetical protein [Halalkalibacter wakoensis]GAE26660.1 hypothetical protein JCM9140_2744 [Halalkalibacter wakoensis JCM 9140]